MKLRNYALTFAIFIPLATLSAFAQRTSGGAPAGNTAPRSPSIPSSVPDITNRSQVTIEVRLDGRETVNTPVMVELLLMGAPIAQSHTDGSGRATFSNLGHGSYTARISGPDIQPTTVNFTIDFGGTQTVTASVQRDTNAQERMPGGVIDASELNAPKNAHKEYEKGVHEFSDKHFEKAEEHFRKAVAEYPKYSSAWNGIGSIRMQANDVAGAEECYRRALEANPNNNFAARNLARLLVEKKNTKEAEQLMKRALVTEPNHPESLIILAYAELQNGEFDDAIATAKRVHTGTTHGGALSHLIAARALELKQQNVAAISEYQLFLKEAPKSPQAKIAQDALARLGATQEASR